MVKNPGNGRLNNLNDPSRPQCVKEKRERDTVSSGNDVVVKGSSSKLTRTETL